MDDDDAYGKAGAFSAASDSDSPIAQEAEKGGAPRDAEASDGTCLSEFGCKGSMAPPPPPKDAQLFKDDDALPGKLMGSTAQPL